MIVSCATSATMPEQPSGSGTNLLDKKESCVQVGKEFQKLLVHHEFCLSFTTFRSEDEFPPLHLYGTFVYGMFKSGEFSYFDYTND